MDLHTYLLQPGAPTATELARLVEVNPDQLRHWRHGYQGRRPEPENCVRIEQATKGAVSRKDLRPDDWHRIWPELVTKPRKKAEA